mmetsp:Transcript_72149/g.121063  ORF Transcript_72149/g.121063 Transcript_72149/m.121063 type:complete len:111 (+) Transcript_72149:1162-1494(+)
MRKDVVYYSDRPGAGYATKAIMPQSAASTQSINPMHLKTKASGPIEKCTAKIHGAKVDGTNAWCCLGTGVPWTSGDAPMQRCAAVCSIRIECHWCNPFQGWLGCVPSRLR